MKKRKTRKTGKQWKKQGTQQAKSKEQTMEHGKNKENTSHCNRPGGGRVNDIKNEQDRIQRYRYIQEHLVDHRFWIHATEISIYRFVSIYTIYHISYIIYLSNQFSCIIYLSSILILDIIYNSSDPFYGQWTEKSCHAFLNYLLLLFHFEVHGEGCSFVVSDVLGCRII